MTRAAWVANLASGRNCAALPVGLLLPLSRIGPVRDLLFSAKHLSATAKSVPVQNNGMHPRVSGRDRQRFGAE
jgi:hypothetical protein